MTTKTAEGKPAESVQSREQQQGHRFLRYSTECSDGASLNFMRARGRRPRPPQLQWTKTGEWPWPKRAATHRSWRAVRRPFLTVLHSSQPPVLGRSDQFRIMCRLLFRRSAVRRGGKVHFFFSGYKLQPSQFCDRLCALQVRSRRLDLRTAEDDLPCDQLPRLHDMSTVDTNLRSPIVRLEVDREEHRERPGCHSVALRSRTWHARTQHLHRRRAWALQLFALRNRRRRYVWSGISRALRRALGLRLSRTNLSRRLIVTLRLRQVVLAVVEPALAVPVLEENHR